MEDEWVTEGHYNVEMQVAQRPGLKRRSRYYHSQIDMDLLVSGTDYELLPDTYVIFLCDFDPFEEGRYRYSFEERCQESPLLYLEDGRHTVFLSTKGTNEEDEPEVLVKFLKFVGAGLEKSTEDFEDDYIERLQTSIRRIKADREIDREMGERFMTFEELLKDERAKGKAEGRAEGKAEAVLELLQLLGTVPDNLRQRISQETDLQVLCEYLVKAAQAKSMEQFIEVIS